MLVLFETAAGFALFKVTNEAAFEAVRNSAKELENQDFLNQTLELQKFVKFKNIADALQATADVCDGKISKKLKKLLKKSFRENKEEILAVADNKLSRAIGLEMKIRTMTSEKITNLMRGIRVNMDSMLPIDDKEMQTMRLGLAHSLDRYKLKCNPDKIDTMIVQAIGLLDDLDKEINNYVMRCKEMYGWHFPELSKILDDNMAYVKFVKHVGIKSNVENMEIGEIVGDEKVDQIKDAIKISLGTDLTDKDIEIIQVLCDQILDLSDERAVLYEYIGRRMVAVAPNLTSLVGEILGARLIAKAGRLVNLAKHAASTVQILGAEKALFRALKTRHATPKYGLLYHASLVGQASASLKGKMSRMLAAKAALSIRLDALGDETADKEMGARARVYLEKKLNELESGVDKNPVGFNRKRSFSARGGGSNGRPFKRRREEH
nr:Nucleolar protein 5 [Hymenolepis microstoma]